MSGDLLTPGDFKIPSRARYYLSDLAAHLCKDCPDDPELQRRAEEATLRTLERLCERGFIRGLRVGRNIVVPREELQRVFVAMNTLVSDN